MSRLFLSGSRKICVSAANSRRNLAQKDERKQSSPQPPEIHEHSLQEGNINHSTLPENEQESTEDNARESTTALPLQTNIAGTESQTHCLEMSYLQGTDKCASSQNISIQRENKTSNTALITKIASNSGIQSPKDCIDECANKQNANSLGECQVPSNSINDNIAASVSDIHRSKEIIDECASSQNISTQRENKTSNTALITKITSNSGIQSPKECTDECTNKQNANSLGECQVPSNAINDSIAAIASNIQRPKELTDECTNKPTHESKRVGKASTNELAANTAVAASGIQSPKENIKKCTNRPTIESKGVIKASNNELAVKTVAAASDVQSPKEIITECASRPALKSKRVSKALAADLAPTASSIQGPKECNDESTSGQGTSILKVNGNSSKALPANAGATYLEIQQPREFTLGFKQPGLASNTSRVNFEEKSIKKHIGSRKMNASIASSEGSFFSQRKSAMHAAKLKDPAHDPKHEMHRFVELQRKGKSIAKSLDHQKKLDMALDRMKIDIPRSLELEIHAEASAIVEDLVQAYKKLLGRNHPLTVQAKEHISMISHTGRQRLPRGGVLPTMIVESVDHEKVKIN